MEYYLPMNVLGRRESSASRSPHLKRCSSSNSKMSASKYMQATHNSRAKAEGHMTSQQRLMQALNLVEPIKEAKKSISKK